MPTLILAGGGHAHVEVLRRFGRNPPDGVRVIVISPDTHTGYSGMLPGLIAGHYTWEDSHIDLRPLCDRAGAEFLPTRVEGIDPADRRVHCTTGQTYEFEVLSLDIGSTPDLRSVPGAVEHAVPVKPVSEFLESWGNVTARCAGRSTGRPRLAVVGGGAGGVEIALAMRHRCRRADPADEPEIALVTDGLVPTHASSARLLLERALAEHRVTLVRQGRVTQIMPGEVQCASGEPVPADFVVWATGASAPAWIGQGGLQCDHRGFVAVNDHLQSTSHPSAFAAGDIATMVSRPLPKAGVFAVRQGPLLAENLRRHLAGEPLLTYRPQRRFLSLISTGDRHAVASYAGLSWQGPWVWAWKDRIDRRFVRKYDTQVQQMAELTAHAGDHPLSL
jgi:selenide,water dikinase